MEVWVAVPKSGKKEKNKILMVFILMMKHKLKINNKILINLLKVLRSFY